MVKLVDGTLDSSTAIAAGNGVHGGALRVTIASDSTGQVALAAGTAAIGKLVANSGVDIGDVDVTSCALPTGAATAAKQGIAGTDLVGGAGAVAAGVQRVTLASDDPAVVDLAALEVLATTIDADTSNMATSLGNMDNAVDGNYLNVNANIAGTDITGGAGAVGASTPRVTLASDDPAVAKLTTIDADTSSLAGCVGGTEMQVDVVSSALPTGASTAAKQGIAGTDLVGNSGNLAAGVQRVCVATDDVNVSAIKTAVETLDNCISGSEAQVDVVGALPAGTNSIGQVTANPSKLATTDDAEFMRKYYTNAGAVTDGIVWSPAAGKRWYVTDLIINVSAAATVTLEDDKAGGDDPVMKFEFAANGGMVSNFKTPLASGEDAADLIITTSAGNVYVTAIGYEV